MSQIRLHLDSGLTLRAQADAIDDRGARVSAELPWLRVGGDAELELDVGNRRGRIDWIGLEPGPDGAARLTVRIAFERARVDETLPYFSTREPGGTHEESSKRDVIEMRDTSDVATEPTEPVVLLDSPKRDAPLTVKALVQVAEARRAALASWRVGLASLALLTLLGIVLLVR